LTKDKKHVKYNFLNFVLNRRPRSGNFLSWLFFVLAFLIIIPLFLLMLVLIPVLFIIKTIKVRFFPSKKPKVFMSPMGISVYSQVDRSLENYPWQEIDKVEVWSEQDKTAPVLILKTGQPIKLVGTSIRKIKQICARFNVRFYEDIVIVQDAG